jgi:hypothetical protein
MKVDFFADSIESADELIPIYKAFGDRAGHFFVPVNLEVIMHLAGRGIAPMPLDKPRSSAMRALVANMERSGL